MDKKSGPLPGPSVRGKDARQLRFEELSAKLKETSVKYQSILLIFLLMFLIACNSSEQGSDVEVIIPVSVEEIRPSSIEEFVTASGTVQAYQSRVYKAETGGYYHLQNNRQTGKPFVMGDVVKKGQVIIRLENPEYENNIKIDAQRLNLDISKREYEKQQSLYEKGGVTLRELKDAERTYIEAKYAYENARLQLAKLDITSTMDGILVNLPFFPEQTLIEAGQVLAEVMDYSRLYADLNFPARDLGKIKEGQKIRVTHYNFPEDTLYGEVFQVSPAVSAENRSFSATVVIENQDRLLRPGMFVQIETIVARKERAIVIPREIILSKRRGKTVFVVEKGAAFERVISTGLENEQYVEVVEGLKRRERLVTKGFETLRDRTRVKIVQ